MTRLSGFLKQHETIVQLIVITLVVFVAMSWASPRFLRYYNFESMAFIAPELGIISIAMMIAMLTGGIDLSVVGIANLAGILAGTFFLHVMPAAPDAGLAYAATRLCLAVVIALVTGFLAGILNGLLISRLRITPILATLGTGQLFTGFAVVLTGGPAIVGFPPGWGFIGNGKLLGVPLPLLLFAVVAIAVAVMLSRTSFGVKLMLIGTNPKAAVFAGLRSARMILLSYMLTGTLAALAGIILSGRTNAAKSDYGTSYLLQAVLVAVLGGTNPAGGRGSVLGVTIAVVALMLLSSGFQILRFSNHLIDFIWGAFLIAVIALNAYRARTR